MTAVCLIALGNSFLAGFAVGIIAQDRRWQRAHDAYFAEHPPEQT